MENRLANDLDDILARTEPLWSDLRGERILITGATGFFGCWLLESFAWANRRLNLHARAVGLSRHPETLAKKAPHLAADPAIAFHAADIRLGNFPHGQFSHVIHAATEASAKLNGEAPAIMFDTIVDGHAARAAVFHCRFGIEISFCQLRRGRTGTSHHILRMSASRSKVVPILSIALPLTLKASAPPNCCAH